MPTNEKQYKAGDYMVVDFYPTKKPPRTRSRKRNPTRDAQKWLNDKKSDLTLELLINENFTTQDYALHPTYTDAYLPSSPEQAIKDMDNYIRRLKRLYKSQGEELKYIRVIEYGEGRYHHHLIVSGGIPPQRLVAAWGMGVCNPDLLQFSERGLKGLQKYMTKERMLVHRWSGSRNLKRPQKPKERNVKKREFQKLWDDYDNRKLWEARYPDYYFVESERTDNASIMHGEQYITVRMCRKDAQLTFISDVCYSGGLPYLKRRGRTRDGTRSKQNNRKEFYHHE